MSSIHRDRLNSFFGYGYNIGMLGGALSVNLPTCGNLVALALTKGSDYKGVLKSMSLGSAASILLLPITLPIMVVGLTASFALLACSAIAHLLSYPLAAALDFGSDLISSQFSSAP